MTEVIQPTPTQYLTPKQAAKIYPFSAGYFARHAEEFGGLRIGGGEHRTGRLLFTIEGIERALQKNQHRRPKKN